jgi:hypothetical protein
MDLIESAVIIILNLVAAILQYEYTLKQRELWDVFPELFKSHR